MTTSEGLYRISLACFERECHTCGGTATAVHERHSSVWIEVSLFWECRASCYEALSSIQRHNGQIFKNPEELLPFFKRGYLLEIQKDGSLSVQGASFYEVLSIRKQESAAA